MCSHELQIGVFGCRKLVNLVFLVTGNVDTHSFERRLLFAAKFKGAHLAEEQVMGTVKWVFKGTMKGKKCS